MEDEKSEKLIEEMLEDSIIYIKIFNRELTNLSDKKFMKTFFWLVTIKNYDNLSMSGLAKTLNISKTQITPRIDELVNNGLLERVPDENDRRVLRIALTAEGEDLIHNSNKTVKEALNLLLNPLSPDELEELGKSIETIKNTVLKIQGVI
ncbi:regulatory protein MarR [Methanobacterium lacus]|uniref:Regulatory protein MarR n=1 Tax=Methanobacterium lacus (strain AL-21) TaxID=877455 RepID=F0T8H5_METLA|nr:MarR family transcriptional regulator [Methanobacterium lacus]ADZ09726.1 regulatory protein MarR [Methanobacterium lacus]